MRYSILFLAILAISSCSFESPKGTGPIIISENVEEGFKKYKEEQSPGYFAVSLNGQRYGYSYCKSQTCLRGGQTRALQKCNSRHAELRSCRIFARGENIVWDGPVHFRSSGKPDPEIFGDKPYFFGPVFD